MNDLIATTVAENCCNFTALVAGDQTDVGGGIGREAAPRLDPGAGTDDDAIAALEGALDPDDSRGEKALAAAQGTGRPVVDDQRAGRVDRGGDPCLACRARLAV